MKNEKERKGNPAQAQKPPYLQQRPKSPTTCFPLGIKHQDPLLAIVQIGERIMSTVKWLIFISTQQRSAFLLK